MISEAMQMQTEEMMKIFDFEKIQIDKIDENHFEEKHDLYDNFHKLEERDGVWNLILEIHERRHGEEIEKTFRNRDEAIKYFCFSELRKKYIHEYLFPIINDNDKMGAIDFTAEELKKIFDELGIMSDLYEFNSYKGNAINLLVEQNGKYSLVFLDGQKNVIRKTLEFELPEALFFMFEMVYLMHIMKTHLAEMQKIGLLQDGVSNEDYLVLLE